jgi:hypothetical protein
MVDMLCEEQRFHYQEGEKLKNIPYIWGISVISFLLIGVIFLIREEYK